MHQLNDHSWQLNLPRPGLYPITRRSGIASASQNLQHQIDSTAAWLLQFEPGTMALQTAVDVPLNITSENSRSERRITPAWTIAQLKGRLEPITGIPASSQRLTLRLGGSQAPIDVSAADEEATQLASFPLQAYAELNVCIDDLRVVCSSVSARFISVLDHARWFVLLVLWTILEEYCFCTITVYHLFRSRIIYPPDLQHVQDALIRQLILEVISDAHRDMTPVEKHRA